MAALIFFPTAAPAEFIAAQLFFFSLAGFVVEQTLQYLHRPTL